MNNKSSGLSLLFLIVLSFSGFGQDTNSVSRNELLGRAAGFRLATHSLVRASGVDKKYSGERYSFDVEHYSKYRFITSYDIDFFHVNPDHYSRNNIVPYINYHFTTSFRVNRFQKSNSIWTVGLSLGCLYNYETEGNWYTTWVVRDLNYWGALHSEYRYQLHNRMQISARIAYEYNDYFNSTFSFGLGIHYLPFHSGLKKLNSGTDINIEKKKPVSTIYITTLNLGIGFEQTFSKRDNIKKPYFCFEAGYMGFSIFNTGFGYYELKKHSVDFAITAALFDLDFMLMPRVGYRHNSQKGLVWRIGGQLYIFDQSEIIPLPFFHLGYTFKQPELKKQSLK